MKRESASAEEIEAARELHGSDEIEIDDDAYRSRAEEDADGTWVSGWLWVPDDA
mgnify:CR=1 FL=1|tara:strand:+ start:505 stop:666 length:162 start_codon:yes stop_codon:yes gene_type:complete